MGYEIELIIVNTTSLRGYCSVIATVDLCKPGYESHLLELKASLPENEDMSNNSIASKQRSIRKIENGLCTREEDYRADEDDRAGLLEKLRKLEETTREYTYIYKGDKQTFVDLYDDPLQLYNIHDVLEALQEDELTANYRRFKTAIALLQSFVDNPTQWKLDKIKVIMWGH